MSIYDLSSYASKVVFVKRQLKLVDTASILNNSKDNYNSKWLRRIFSLSALAKLRTYRIVFSIAFDRNKTV